MAVRCLKCMKEYADGVSKCPHCGYEESLDEGTHCYLPPRTILKGRYMIGCCLGSGGFGVTYVAWDSLLEKKVAIKEYLPSELASRTMGDTRITVHDTECIEKYNMGKKSFLEESRRLAKFNSCKGIVSIFDCFDENGTAYIVMECLEGKTLQQMINERKKLPFKEVLPLFIDVLEALDVVHGAGMMHRDIAPDNIFVCSDGTAKLIDFGAARYMTTTHSRSLSMILKIGYAPIEQYTKKGNQGPWTDVYAVAASLYHAVTGVIPPDSYDRVEEDKLRKPSLMARGLPKHAETAILNALNIIETNRTQTAKQFAEELKGDLDVARIREKIQHEDTGRIAKWMKYSAAGIGGFIVLLGVLFVATGGKLFRLGNFFVPDGMSRVPHIINESVSDADKKLTESTLHLVIDERVTDSFFENNYVIIQNPRQGNLAYKGSVVTATASMKPDEYFVPDLKNFTKDAAVMWLESAGFNVVIEQVESDKVAYGSVVKQTPEGNSMIYEGATIKLFISSGSKKNNVSDVKLAKTPNYFGLQFETAQTKASDYNINVAISNSEYSDTVPKGQIIAQFPPSGDPLYDGIMYVTVSLGAKTIVVPNLFYLSQKEAVDKLEKCLLRVKMVEVESKYVQTGLVVNQYPLPGKSMNEDGEVTIYISVGYRVKVPDVVGMEKEKAQNALAAAGLSYSVTLENSDTVPKGCVIRQTINSGEEVLQGTIIPLVISSGKESISVKGVSLDKKKLSLESGEIYTLVATVSPKNATNTGVTWSSDNTSVVTVDESGVITCKAPGTATVTVRTNDGGFTAQCVVTVKKVLRSLTVESEPNKTSYYYGEPIELSGLKMVATYSDGSVEDVTDKVKLSKFDSLTNGNKVITATYEFDGVSKVTSFNLRVRRLYSIFATIVPVTYKVGANKPSKDDFINKGLSVTATYDDGSSRNVVKFDSCEVSGFDSSKPGANIIKVVYSEDISQSGQFSVIIQGDLVILYNDLEVATVEPTKGDEITLSVKDKSGNGVNVKNWTSSKTSYADIISGGNSQTVTIKANDVGRSTITVTDENGATASINVAVYGEWSTDWVVTPYKDESLYEYKSRDEYSVKETTTVTTSYYNPNVGNMDGWTEYREPTWGDYGAKIGPYSSKYSDNSDYRQNWSEEKQRWRYWAYCSGTKTASHGRCSDAFDDFSKASVHSIYKYEQQTPSTSEVCCPKCGYNHPQYWVIQGTGCSSWYFFEEPEIEIQWYYHDREKYHYYYRWSEWRVGYKNASEDCHTRVTSICRRKPQ